MTRDTALSELGTDANCSRQMPLLLKAAILCGAIPLVAGSLVYFTWRLTEWDWITIAGISVIAVGVASFIAGAACLLRHLWREFCVERAARHRLWIQGLLVGSLLLINFPLALFYVFSADEISTRYTVRVVNKSGAPIDSFILTAPRVRIELGPIPAGDRVRRHLHFVGNLDFSARQQQHQFDGQVEEYFDGISRGEKFIIIKDGGIFEFQTNAVKAVSHRNLASTD